MAKASPDTIILKGDPIMSEREAGGVVTPGQMLIRNSAGAVVVNAAAADVDAPATFAKENDIAGDDLTHAYASGEVVLFFTGAPGMQVFAVLEDGQNVAIGAALETNGSGDLQAKTTGRTVGVALEALDLSATGFAIDARRIKVELV